MNEYKFKDIKIGMEESFEACITEEKMKAFREITGDINPRHNRENNEKENVVFGMLTTSFLSTLAGVYLPGKYSLIHSVEILFKKPVYIKDNPLTITGKVIDINDQFKQITIQFDIRNCKNEKVSRGIMKVGVTDE